MHSMRKKYICTDKFIFSVDHQCHDKVVGSWTDFVSSSRPINGIKNLVSNANAGLMLCYSTLGAFTTFPFGWFTSIKARAVLLIHDTTMGPKDFTHYLYWQNCESFYSIKYGSSNILSNIQLLIANICFFYKILFFTLKSKQYENRQYCRLFQRYIWKLMK